MKKTPFLLLIVTLLAGACSKALVVRNVDYSQSIETVLTPDETGQVTDVRHGISFNVLALQYEEQRDSSTVNIDKLRLIRNNDGFYFITAQGFKHVYIMEPKRGSFKLKKKVLVSDQGLLSPAFNSRASYIQLLDTATSQVYNLNQKGIYKEEAS